MKKTLFFVLLLLAGLGVGAASQEHQHRACHLVVFRGGAQEEECGGTAVRPNVLLTAQHCVLSTPIYLDESDAPHYVVAVIPDDHDSALLVLSDSPFREWVKLAPHSRYRRAAQGDLLHWWGNPSSMRDLYRVGALAGVVMIDNDPRAAPVFLLAAPTSPGDSGSGIFARDGRLVGVLSYGVSAGRFAGFYELDFSEAQLAKAGL